MKSTRTVALQCHPEEHAAIHLAAPQLFEVQYEEAKAIAQELAQFRAVPAAMSAEAVRIAGGKARAQQKRDHAAANSPINAPDYIAELNPPAWHDGFRAGQTSKSAPGEDRFRRFARLRRRSGGNGTLPR